MQRANSQSVQESGQLVISALASAETVLVLPSAGIEIGTLSVQNRVLTLSVSETARPPFPQNLQIMQPKLSEIAEAPLTTIDC